MNNSENPVQQHQSLRTAVASPELKAAVLNAVYATEFIERTPDFELLTAKHLKTGVGIVVVEGNFSRDSYKRAMQEIKDAGLRTTRMYVYGQTATYSGQGICFSKFEEIGIQVPPPVASSKDCTKTVCRTGYGFADVTVKVPVDASEEDIEMAVLDAAGNYSYSEKDAEYQVEGSGQKQTHGVDLSSVLAQLMQQLSGAGFSADEEIDGADAVVAVTDAYSTAVEQLKGTPYEPFVIFSASEDGCWNKDIGWADAENSATHFYLQPGNLPQSAGNDAVLVRLSQLEQLVAGAATSS